MPIVNGAHVVVYSKNPDADRGFLRDVLGLPHVDAGDGWLIFALPPAEVAVHPGDRNGVHELYLTVDDLAAFVGAMAEKGLACAPTRSVGWGVLTQLSLPGGGTLGVYQPRHRRPTWTETTRRKVQRRAKKRVAPGRSRSAGRSTAGKRRPRRAAR